MDNSTDIGTLQLLTAIYTLHFTILATEGHKMGMIPDSEYKTYIANGIKAVNSMNDEIVGMIAPFTPKGGKYEQAATKIQKTKEETRKPS